MSKRPFTLEEAVAKLLSEAIPQGDCLISWRKPSAARPYIKAGGRTMVATRAVWELAYGPIVGKMDVHHRCRTGRCVNLEHLELKHPDLHRVEHQADSHPLKTHCPQGHPYSGDNLYIRPDTGVSQCKACGAARNEIYRKTPRGKQVNQEAVRRYDASEKGKAKHSNPETRAKRAARERERYRRLRGQI